MQGQRTEPGPARSSKVLQASHRRKAKSAFLGQEVSLRCLRWRYRAIIEGQFLSGVNDSSVSMTLDIGVTVLFDI